MTRLTLVDARTLERVLLHQGSVKSGNDVVSPVDVVWDATRP